MASSIEIFMNNSPDRKMDTASFRNILEDHLEYFRNHPNTRLIEITAHDANVYQFDWIGLLRKHGVPEDLHWLTIRLNGGMSYVDLGQDARSILVPDSTEVSKLLQMHTTSRKKK